jgi:hypothetical protein
MNNSLIQNLGGLLIYVAGFVTAAWKGFDYLSARETIRADIKKKEFEEKSVGMTAIAQFTKDILGVRKDIDDLIKEDTGMKRDINKLMLDYDNLINRFLDFLRK